MKNNFITKIIGATLAFAMMIGGAVGINAAKQAKEVNAAINGNTFNRISTVADLSDGDEIIFVNQAETYACGTTQNTNNRTPVAITISNHSYTYSSSNNVQVFVVKISGNNYGFHTGSGYIYSASSSSNNLKTNDVAATTAPSGTSAWGITISNYVANVTNKSNTNYYLAFNGTSYFSQYKQGQIKPYIYKKVSDPSKTIQANSVTIKQGNSVISGTYEPSSPYYFGDELDLSNSEVNYEQGDTFQNGSGAINWTSSNANVATVANGIVTYVSAGTTTITATAVDKGENNATVSASFTLDLSNATSAPGSSANPYTVAQALAANPANGVYVEGIISTITEVSLSYHNAVYRISDDGSQSDEMIVYHGKYTGNTNFTAEHQIQLGDKVVVTGNLTDYKGTNQLGQDNYITSLIPVKYTVTYNANGADSGNAPVDANEYQRNISTGITSVTTKANTGNLQKAGYSFNGWNTKADPTADGAVHYNANAEIQITSNLSLYAEWLSLAPSITVQANLSGYTGQSVDLDFSYGNIANESNLSVVAADNKVTVGDLIADGGVGAVTITFNTAGETSLSFRNNGEELATCAVVVNQSEISITGLSSKGKVQIGATLNLGTQVTINHSGIYSGDVVWESSDTDVATVSDNGVVTGKAVGQATITVTSYDKLDVYQSCVVNVYKGPICNALDLSKASYVSSSDELVKWSCDYAEIANAKGTGTNANNYLGGANTSTRMYKNNIMTITPNVGYIISSVEFIATTNGYANALKNSAWTNATTVSDETLVTVTPTDGSVAFGATISGTCGFTAIKIYIAPNSLLKTSSVIKTISGVESNEGATVTNVALRFGGVIPVSTWNQINSNWAITDFGVMFARGSMLTARSLDSLEKVFRNDPADVAMVHRGAVGTPNANGDDYIFTARLNLEEVDYDEVFYAAPFIVAGGEYYFLQEMHYSVRTLAEECLTSGESSLSQAALTTLKGNN